MHLNRLHHQEVVLYQETSSSGFERLVCNPTFSWIARRRGMLSVLVGLIAVAYALWGHREPLDFIGSDRSPYWIAPWSLALLGAGVRIWGAGNLSKNQEVTWTGIYRMVRHPLYLGNCLIYIAFLVSLDGPVLGLMLFFMLLLGVHYPSMVQEEARLAREHPREFEAANGTPRLIPDIFSFRAALATDRCSVQRILRNYGLRGLWGPILLPVVAEVLLALRSWV
jgi:protein-S-isoprenylcysteine O-methyltransferase Ste14